MQCLENLNNEKHIIKLGYLIVFKKGKQINLYNLIIYGSW